MNTTKPLNLALLSCFCAAALLGADSTAALKPAAGADAPAVAAPQPVILLVAATPLDAAAVEGIRASMQTDLSVVVGHSAVAASATDAEALKAAAGTPAPVFCRVIFWRGESSLVGGFQLLPDAKAVLVDVTPLLADKPDAKKLENRLERQAMRGMGLLLGLEYVNGPPCALRRINSLKELDSLSRNFSPPAQGRFRQLIQMEGARLLDVPEE